MGPQVLRLCKFDSDDNKRGNVCNSVSASLNGILIYTLHSLCAYLGLILKVEGCTHVCMLLLLHT